MNVEEIVLDFLVDENGIGFFPAAETADGRVRRRMDAWQYDVARSVAVVRVPIPRLLAGIAKGFVVGKPLVAFGEMIVGKEMILSSTSTYRAVILLLESVHSSLNFTPIVRFGFDQRLSEQTR